MQEKLTIEEIEAARASLKENSARALGIAAARGVRVNPRIAEWKKEASAGTGGRNSG